MCRLAIHTHHAGAACRRPGSENLHRATHGFRIPAMAIPAGLIVEVATILERFRVKALPAQVASLAAFYRIQRPTMPARAMAEAMIGGPRLPWPLVLNTTEARIEVMAILVDRLDRQYWVDTFEHDRAGVAD